MRHLDTIYCTATIRAGASAPRTTLHLKLDAEDCFRWFTSDGHDTDIHASTLPAAVAVAYTVWQYQDFTIPPSAAIL